MFFLIFGIVILILYWCFSSYNGLVAMSNRTDQAFADIDVQLKQRHDLIPNLIETVKGYAAHEKETLDAVVKARNAALTAAPADKGASEGMLGQALGRLLSLTESYPDLKANASFLQLQTELGETENKLAAARRFFNNAVQEFNTACGSLPAVFFAAKYGFTPKKMFDVGADTRVVLDQAPTVKF
jgi:LemA protein